VGGFYGLTDRRPSADAADGNESERVPDSCPQIRELDLLLGEALALEASRGSRK
jgi:hypothetical protein